MRKKLYLAKLGPVYVNYINLYSKNTLRLKDYYTKESYAKLKMEYNRLKKESQTIKGEIIILDCLDKVMNKELIRQKKKDFESLLKEMQILNVLMDNSRNTKTECILYTKDDFSRIKELHPDIQFVNIYDI